MLLSDLLNPGYLAVRMEPGTNQRKIIGLVNCRGGGAPGWVHSFAVTERYIIIPEMPLRYSVQSLLRPTSLYAFEWCAESKAFLHVMCKDSRKIAASVEVPLYIAIHFINAYEETNEDARVKAIIADCCEYYADTTLLEKLTMQNLRSFNGQDVPLNARVGRFIIPLDGNTPTVVEPDVHLDLVKKKAKNWHEEGIVPSEPLFVAWPGAIEEADGVVISTISEKIGCGYAVLLDGSTFEEIASARFPLWSTLRV
ncbi:Carotenoid cleavage dioxygenase 8 [Melia azedarach]|uniref:Carotenoid cleavage dioxygenase 8 n=1 Tax=Melia azedarach TaxID=155640 RepID=A0ACC1X9N3_MELAZ|nr:Carotenoid cleavage dioxygenase 8 [Melia azedarach]